MVDGFISGVGTARQRWSDVRHFLVAEPAGEEVWGLDGKSGDLVCVDGRVVSGMHEAVWGGKSGLRRGRDVLPCGKVVVDAAGQGGVDGGGGGV